MSIISLPFIGFVILLVGLYFLLPKKCQWVILLLASVVFYLSGGWQGIFYILATIITQYFLALVLERQNAEMKKRQGADGVDSEKKREIKQQFSKRKHWVVALSVIINLGVLATVKYLGLAVNSFNRLFGTSIGAVDLLVPIGLSYYTFKSIGYVIDVSRGRIQAQRNIFKLALYIGYFPALVQGPIDKYEELAEQLYAEHEFSYERLCFGTQRMLWGYMKKLIIAERAAVIVNTIQNNYASRDYEGFLIVLMLIFGAVHLYVDFSGGMDIALGLSEIFGISMTENFRRPFLSHSVAEYWRRWHISLGAWMGTYVFTPLSLSQPFKKLGKKAREKMGNKYGRVIAPSIASFITFFLVGIWHGLSLGYILFAVYNATLVSTATLLEDFYAWCRGKFKVHEDSKAFKGFQIIRTFVLTAICRFFYLPKFSDTVGLFKATFSEFNPWVFFDGTLYSLGLDRPNFILLVISIIVLILVDFAQEHGTHIRETIGKQNIALRWVVYYGAIFALLIFGMYGPGYDAASFIYQRF